MAVRKKFEVVDADLPDDELRKKQEAAINAIQEGEAFLSKLAKKEVKERINIGRILIQWRDICKKKPKVVGTWRDFCKRAFRIKEGQSTADRYIWLAELAETPGIGCTKLVQTECSASALGEIAAPSVPKDIKRKVLDEIISDEEIPTADEVKFRVESHKRVNATPKVKKPRINEIEESDLRKTRKPFSDEPSDATGAQDSDGTKVQVGEAPEGEKRRDFTTATDIWNLDSKKFKAILKELKPFFPEIPEEELPDLAFEDGHEGVRKGVKRGKKSSKGHSGTYSVFPCALALWIIIRFVESELNPLPPGSKIVDPFAGGPPRGIIPGLRGYEYWGWDTQKKQIYENNLLVDKYNLDNVHYIHGRAQDLEGGPSEEFDFCLTCPPYYDLETYGGDDGDLSEVKTYEEFDAGMETAARTLFRRMKNGSFTCVVMANIRGEEDKEVNYKIGLIADTQANFVKAGFELWQPVVLKRKEGTTAIRRGVAHKGNKLVPAYDELIVFRKPIEGEKLFDEDTLIWTPNGPRAPHLPTEEIARLFTEGVPILTDDTGSVIVTPEVYEELKRSDGKQVVEFDKGKVIYAPSEAEYDKIIKERGEADDGKEIYVFKVSANRKKPPLKDRPQPAPKTKKRRRAARKKDIPLTDDVLQLTAPGVPYKVIPFSASWANKEWLPCNPQTVKDVGCKGRCCDPASKDPRLRVSIQPFEEEIIKKEGGKVKDGFLLPTKNEKGKERCPFKNEEFLCDLHDKKGCKPFGCIASPFAFDKYGNLGPRYRYQGFLCYKKRAVKLGDHLGKRAVPAYVGFRASLDMLFGKEEAEKLCQHLEEHCRKHIEANSDKPADEVKIPLFKITIAQDKYDALMGREKSLGALKR